MTRRWIEANYPSKRRLTEAEAENVLRTGPDPAWFEPWIEHGVLLPGARYGYVHVQGGEEGPCVYDVHLFNDREGLSWGLEALHKNHPRCGDECHGLFYFAPDEPMRLRVLVETDGSGDDDADPEAVK